MTKQSQFDSVWFACLAAWRNNNNREWFQAHKQRYGREVRDPMLRFLGDFGPPLWQSSMRCVADSRPSGRSLLRTIAMCASHKTNVPLRRTLGHRFATKRAEMPMRLAFPCTSSLGRCVARGVWHPDGHTFTKIRNAIVEHPQRWQHVISSEAFRATGSLGGDALKRHPSGYDPAHPLLADLKRKDDIAQAHCTAEQACAPDFLPVLTETCRTCAPLMHFLTTALELPWEGDGEGRGVGIRHTTGSAQRGQRLLR